MSYARDAAGRPTSQGEDRRHAIHSRDGRFENVKNVAKVSPDEFIRQVRAEGAKVVWPTGKETWRTAIMVLIMTALLGFFFFGVDAAFSATVQFLLGLLG